MILQWFAELFYKLFTGLLSWINIPSGADQLESIYEIVELAVNNGARLFLFFLPEFALDVLFIIFLAITGFKYGYYLVMWILKKIPAVGIN